MISFVVPAYNEEAFIADTLNAIHFSARVVGEQYEIVVADDASTDRTAEIARSLGARVERVNYRQIAGTRNAGARASVGEFIFFVDADTLVNPHTLRSALTSMKEGAAGGGAITWFKRTEALPAYVWLGFAGLAAIVKFAGFTGGPFLYCTRAAFDATGGFPANMYWAEETPFGLALKREGKFVVPWTPIIMSGRRFRASAKGEFVQGVKPGALVAPKNIHRSIHCAKRLVRKRPNGQKRRSVRSARANRTRLLVPADPEQLHLHPGEFCADRLDCLARRLWNYRQRRHGSDRSPRFGSLGNCRTFGFQFVPPEATDEHRSVRSLDFILPLAGLEFLTLRHRNLSKPLARLTGLVGSAW
jgi:hypothetical protein